jgi:serine/threonine protein kinase
MNQVPSSTCDHEQGGIRLEPEADDRRIGQLVDGKYHILRRLACGGMGSVYEARHTVVGRHFALKFLHEHYAQKSCMAQRLLREAQAAGSIASEHIIGVLDYGTTDGTPYLVMELVRGQDMRELLAESPRLPVLRAVRIIIDACRGLELAHERGLVHRDLKPANICITRRSDGREVAKVIDFGVAKLRDGTDLSEEGTLIGTVGYMAPEQLTDQKQVDARADIYALGVILYQALAGRPPHVCNRSELLYRIVSVDPRPLDELCSALPPGLSDVVHRALYRNKERRYASAREFAQALERYAREESDPLHEPPELQSRPRSRGVGLGTAETEIESAPTWVALAPTTHLKADHREQLGHTYPAQAKSEQFCHQPDGVGPLPKGPALTRETRHVHSSQRALVLSVGALALSVVAMTTMFIFVYSHGSGALEGKSAAGSAPAHTTEPPAAPPSLAPLPAGSLALQAPDRCPTPDPLVRTSIIELAGETGLSVREHALQPMAPSGGSSALPLDCD